MIRVLIQHDPDGTPVDLGMLEIVPLLVSDDGDSGSYAVRVATDRAGAVGLHNLVIPAFPRTKLNSLGLLHEALKWIALTRPDILELEDGTSTPHGSGLDGGASRWGGFRRSSKAQGKLLSSDQSSDDS